MRRLKSVRRKEPLGWGSFLLFGIAFALSLCVCALLLMAQGKDGVLGIRLLLEGGFGYDYALEDTLLKAIPIFLCSLGVAVCFRMQIWNIGAEGQFALGAIGGTAVVLLFPGAPAYLLLPGILLGAMIGGGLWAAIPAGLRLAVGMNEIISSLMLNYIGIFFLEYLVFGPWMDPQGSRMPESMPFPSAAILPDLFGRIHAGLLVCMLAALILGVFFKKSRMGFEIVAAGENAAAARYAGIPYGKLTLFVFCLCGALAGLAGIVETSAVVEKLRASVMVGYGYTAIVVAWLARLRILRIIFFSFLLAGLRVGVENLQLELGISSAFGGVLEGTILLLVLISQFFETYSWQWWEGPQKQGKGPRPDSPTPLHQETEASA